MIDPSFRNALLEQNGETPVEAQLTVLDELVKADRQYIHRLTIWTIVGWAACVTILALAFSAIDRGRAVQLPARRGRPAHHHDRLASFGDDEPDPGQPRVDRRPVETDPIQKTPPPGPQE